MLCDTAIPRQHLIEMGLKAFTEKGYHGVGLQEVLEAANIPKGSFYNYFKSKEAFGAAVVEHFSAQYVEVLRQHLGDRKRTPIARLKGLFQWARDYHAQEQRFHCCLVAKLGAEVAELNPLMRIVLKSSTDQWLALFAQVLREAQIAGELASGQNPERLAQFLHDAWEGALIRMKVEQSVAPLDTFLEFAFERLLAR